MNPLRRTLAGALLALCTLPLHAADATYGSHGMALFGGKEGLYASHLPMFHAPHDFQVVLQVHIADPAIDAALRKRLDGKAALWTIDPEKFELSALAPQAARPRSQFRASVVQGHFERKGSVQYRDVQVVIDKVLMFRQLNDTPRSANEARYMQLGSGTQRFLLKEIDTRPDFDHILAYQAPPGASTATLKVRKRGMQQPSAEEIAQVLRVPASTIASIYFETGDLQ